jgi:hypothetical protein
MKRSGVLWVVACVSWAASMSGCLERQSAPIGPNIGFGQSVSVGGHGVSSVDLLFVIDDSGSMREEQANLAVQIPNLVRDLASPPDRDEDGELDWNPVELLRIGIVTTDVGTGAVEFAGSRCVANGDDGALRGGIFEWRPGDDPGAFAESVRATVDSLGIVGCAFEQPLEAAARALGHASETGFPSDDGLFALVVVSDEEDCSVEDDTAFFSSLALVTANVHCTRGSAQLTPVATLLEQIRGGRPEGSFIYAAIAGVPVDVTADATPRAILERSDMQYVEVADGTGLRMRPACEARDASGRSLGVADPARRLVTLADLVPDSVVTTICTDDFGPAIDRVAARIGSKVPGVCLARGLPAGSGATVSCEVSVRLPVGETCAGRPGYTAIGTVDGRAECDLAQAPGGVGSGFHYEPGGAGADCPQLVITADAQPPIGSEVSAECFFPLLLEDGDLCARASQCASGWCDPIADVCAPLPSDLPPTGI